MNCSLVEGMNLNLLTALATRCQGTRALLAHEEKLVRAWIAVRGQEPEDSVRRLIAARYAHIPLCGAGGIQDGAWAFTQANFEAETARLESEALRAPRGACATKPSPLPISKPAPKPPSPGCGLEID